MERSVLLREDAGSGPGGEIPLFDFGKIIYCHRTPIEEIQATVFFT